MIATFVFLALAAFVGCGVWTLIHTELKTRTGALIIIIIAALFFGSMLFDLFFKY